MRQTLDGYERAIESLRSMPKVGETKSAVCIKDQAYVERHGEVFLFRCAILTDLNHAHRCLATVDDATVL